MFESSKRKSSLVFFCLLIFDSRSRAYPEISLLFGVWGGSLANICHCRPCSERVGFLLVSFVYYRSESSFFSKDKEKPFVEFLICIIK